MTTWNDDDEGAAMEPEPRPDCASHRELFVPYLDAEVTAHERAQVEAHLAICPDCAQGLESHRRLQSALVESRLGPECDGSHPLRVFENLADRARQKARLPMWRRTPTWIRFAAALAMGAGAVALGIALSRNHFQHAQPSEELLGSLDVLQALEAEGVEPSPELARVLAELSESPDTDDSMDLPVEELYPENL